MLGLDGAVKRALEPRIIWQNLAGASSWCRHHLQHLTNYIDGAFYFLVFVILKNLEYFLTFDNFNSIDNRDFRHRVIFRVRTYI